MGELVNRFVAACDALENGDVSKMEALLADDIEFVTPERVLHGKEEAMTRFRANVEGAWSDLKMGIDVENGVIDGGDCAAVEFLITGIFSGSLDQSVSISEGETEVIAGKGQSIQMRSTDHIWWNGEQITRFHVFYDPAEPMRYVRGELQVADSAAS